MNPVLTATLRRHWQLIGAIAAFVVFTLIHLALFRPAAARYQSALASAGGLETMFNPGGANAVMPARVYALVTENSLTPQDAQDRGSSGALGVILIEELGRLAERAGVSVTASEPGPVVQEPLVVQVRVQVTVRGRYHELVSFLGELSNSRSLVLIDRFELRPGPDSSDQLRLWVSRLYLKQEAARP